MRKLLKRMIEWVMKPTPNEVKFVHPSYIPQDDFYAALGRTGMNLIVTKCVGGWAITTCTIDQHGNPTRTVYVFSEDTDLSKEIGGILYTLMLTR